MAKKKQKGIDYRALKKVLNQYYSFSFKTPRKGKEFTNQQKSAITRKYKKIAEYLTKDNTLNKKEVSFLKYPEKSKLPNIDGIRTNKGVIYKFPSATVKKSRMEKNKWLVVIDPKIAGKKQKRRDVFFPFPPRILYDPDSIEDYVDRLVEKYRPHAIQWGYRDVRSRVLFDPQKLDLYFSSNTDTDYAQMAAIIDRAVKRFKNLLSSDKEKFKKASEKFTQSELYGLLDTVERTDFWSGLNYRRNARREDFTYNGVFFIYFL